jgi:hypothetical protein
MTDDGGMDESRRCTATSNRGERCRKAAILGLTVCLAHGGATARSRAKGERVEADHRALELARRLDVDVPEFASGGDAARYLVSRVTRRAAQFGALADQHGNDLTYTDKTGNERLRAAVIGEQKWLDSLARVLGALAQAESAGRDTASAVELFKMTVTLFTEDVERALCDAGIYDERHDRVLSRLRARAAQRLRASEGLILEQIRILSARPSPADRVRA